MTPIVAMKKLLLLCFSLPQMYPLWHGDLILEANYCALALTNVCASLLQKTWSQKKGYTILYYTITTIAYCKDPLRFFGCQMLINKHKTCIAAIAATRSFVRVTGTDD
jgi:hypothetical protein